MSWKINQSNEKIHRLDSDRCLIYCRSSRPFRYATHVKEKFKTFRARSSQFNLLMETELFFENNRSPNRTVQWNRTKRLCVAKSFKCLISIESRGSEFEGWGWKTFALLKSEWRSTHIFAIVRVEVEPFSRKVLVELARRPWRSKYLWWLRGASGKW